MILATQNSRTKKIKKGNNKIKTHIPEISDLMSLFLSSTLFFRPYNPNTFKSINTTCNEDNCCTKKHSCGHRISKHVYRDNQRDEFADIQDDSDSQGWRFGREQMHATDTEVLRQSVEDEINHFGGGLRENRLEEWMRWKWKDERCCRAGDRSRGRDCFPSWDWA